MYTATSISTYVVKSNQFINTGRQVPKCLKNIKNIGAGTVLATSRYFLLNSEIQCLADQDLPLQS